jgi:uncharacterized protein
MFGLEMKISALPAMALLFLAGASHAAPSFSCSKASTTTERTICAVPRLAALDASLSSAYLTALDSNIGSGAARALRESQRQWLRARSACGADVVCLDASYRDRIDEICGVPVLTGVHWNCAQIPD